VDYRYKSVFSHQIWDYFVNDIESCFKASRAAQDSNNGKGGLNFAAALVILSVLDFCSGFYVGKVQPSTDEVAEFMSKYLSDDDLFKTKAFNKNFYKVFRHGLAHQWSPKGSGVAIDFNKSEILIIDNELPVLNVPPFFNLVCKGLKKYEIELGENKTLNTNFSHRLDEIYRIDGSEAIRLKELLENPNGTE
jgi:hypothetical protein